MQKRKNGSREAFTLLEIMIVIIILGLLAALVVPNIIGKGEDAKRKLVCVQMKSFDEALKMFKIDNGSYPETEEGLDALVKNPSADKYKNYATSAYLGNKQSPKDPWTNKYVYLNKGDGYEIVSLGADGKEGGEGEAADIKLSECQQK